MLACTCLSIVVMEHVLADMDLPNEQGGSGKLQHQHSDESASEVHGFLSVRCWARIAPAAGWAADDDLTGGGSALSIGAGDAIDLARLCGLVQFHHSVPFIS